MVAFSIYEHRFHLTWLLHWFQQMCIMLKSNCSAGCSALQRRPKHGTIGKNKTNSFVSYRIKYRCLYVFECNMGRK